MKKLFKGEIKYYDSDLLHRMQVLTQASACIVMFESMLADIKAKSPTNTNIPIIETILESFRDTLLFASDCWDEGKFQNNYAHKLTVENAKLRDQITKSNAKLSKQTIEISKLKESVQVLYNQYPLDKITGPK